MSNAVSVGGLMLLCCYCRDARNNVIIGSTTSGLFMIRRAAVAIMRPSLGRVGRLLAAPLKLAASMLQVPLNKVLLLTVETAMEYVMGLTNSPYVQWLQVSSAGIMEYEEHWNAELEITCLPCIISVAWQTTYPQLC